MAYKRYIKRGGKVFGPYYYESYRENGIVKKRYVKEEDLSRDSVNRFGLQSASASVGTTQNKSSIYI